MQITITPSLRANPELFTAVSNRSPLLETIIDGSATVAEWSEGKNWKGQRKPASIAISPAVAHQRLTDFLLQVGVVVP